MAPVEAGAVSFPVLCTVPVSGSGDGSSSGSSGIGRDAARRKAIQKRAEIQNHSDSTISMAFKAANHVPSRFCDGFLWRAKGLFKVVSP